MSQRFDEIAKILGSNLSRRQALGKIASVCGGALLGMFGWTRKVGATGPRYDCGNICRPIINTIL